MSALELKVESAKEDKKLNELAESTEKVTEEKIEKSLNYDELTEQEKKDTTINGLQAAISDLYVADFLGYTVDDSDSTNVIVKKSDGTVVTGFEATISKFKVSSLSTGIGTLKIKDVVDFTGVTSGVLTLINKEAAVTDLASEIQRVVMNTVADDLISAGVIDTPKGYDDTTKEKWILVRILCKIPGKSF